MDLLTILLLIEAIATDAIFSWARMFIALFICIFISFIVGVYAATSSRIEKIIIPVVDILQTLPILTFFPVVLFLFVSTIPGELGINISVIFLIITSMLWNILFGVYEAVNALPKEYIELADLYNLGIFRRFRKIFIPASMPRVVEQSILSWSIGLFYLVTSEIFFVGSNSNALMVSRGIGIDFVRYANLSIPGNLIGYMVSVGIFIIFVIGTRLLFFKPFEDYVTRYNSPVAQKQPRMRVLYERVRPIFYRLTTTPVSRISMTFVRKSSQPVKTKMPVKEAKRRAAYGKILGYSILGVLIFSAVYLLLNNAYYRFNEQMVIVALGGTFLRVWFAFFVCLAIAIPLCVYLLFISKHGPRYILLFQIIASIPATILLPVIVTALKGYPNGGELVAFLVFLLSGIWYVVFSTMYIGRSLPGNIMEVKKIFGVRGANAWKNIYLKAMLPGLVTGSVTAIAAEWNASIVAEYFNGLTRVSQGTGIGLLLNNLLSSSNLQIMFLAIINLVVMILIVNTFVWKRLYKKVSMVYK